MCYSWQIVFDELLTGLALTEAANRERESDRERERVREREQVLARIKLISEAF